MSDEETEVAGEQPEEKWVQKTFRLRTFPEPDEEAKLNKLIEIAFLAEKIP